MVGLKANHAWGLPSCLERTLNGQFKGRRASSLEKGLARSRAGEQRIKPEEEIWFRSRRQRRWELCEQLPDGLDSLRRGARLRRRTSIYPLTGNAGKLVSKTCLNR